MEAVKNELFLYLDSLSLCLLARETATREALRWLLNKARSLCNGPLRAQRDFAALSRENKQAENDDEYAT